jgi:hypothetical protein
MAVRRQILAGIMAVGLTAGCGSTSPSTSAPTPTTLRVPATAVFRGDSRTGIDDGWHDGRYRPGDRSSIDGPTGAAACSDVVSGDASLSDGGSGNAVLSHLASRFQRFVPSAHKRWKVL